MTFTQWVEYHNGTKRKSYNTLPTSNITAEVVSVDGFTLSQTDHAGVTPSAGRRSWGKYVYLHVRPEFYKGSSLTSWFDMCF